MIDNAHKKNTRRLRTAPSLQKRAGASSRAKSPLQIKKMVRSEVSDRRFVNFLDLRKKFIFWVKIKKEKLKAIDLPIIVIDI